jgi:hypothetical protein
MAESLYGMLSKMLLDEKTLQEATKKARNKIRKDYDKKVRVGMVQYYLDQYSPSVYKRQDPSPLFLAYKTRSQLTHNGTVVDLWVERNNIDIGAYYRSNSYYHDDGGNWESMTDIHDITGKQYMINVEYFHDEYGGGHGAIEGSWILKNFEAGIHPRTNGWPRKKWARKMKYTEHKDPYTPLQMADLYAKEFEDLDTPYQYIYSEMFKAWQSKF